MVKLKNYKGRLFQILMAAIGIVLILMSIFADEIGIGQGPKGFGLSQWLMLGAGIVMTIIGWACQEAIAVSAAAGRNPPS